MVTKAAVLQAIELLTHVNRRLEAHPDLKLPTAPLLDILSSPDTTPLTRNVTLSYLDQAFSRAASDQKFDLVSTFLASTMLCSVSGTGGSRTQHPGCLIRVCHGQAWKSVQKIWCHVGMAPQDCACACSWTGCWWGLAPRAIRVRGRCCEWRSLLWKAWQNPRHIRTASRTGTLEQSPVLKHRHCKNISWSRL